MQPDPAAVCLLVLSGLPAAGKSKLAGGLATSLQQPFSPPVSIRVVTFDDFLHQDTSHEDGFSPEAWQASRAAGMEHLKQVLTQGSSGSGFCDSANKQRSDRRLLVIADDNMYYTSMRYSCWMLARQARSAYAQCHLDCPLDLALSRNALRQGAARVPDHVIHHMAHVMEAPPATCDHHMTSSANQDTAAIPGYRVRDWQARTLHLPVTDNSSLGEMTDRVWHWLATSWSAPAPAPYPHEAVLQQRMEGQRANAASLVHTADLESRGIVAAAMQAAPKERRPELAGLLHTARQELLGRVRQLSAAHNLQTRAGTGTAAVSMSTHDPASTHNHTHEQLIDDWRGQTSNHEASLTLVQAVQHMLLEFADVCAAL